MNKNDFIDKLEKTLVANNVPDIEDIVNEYEQHFDFKIADGYPEDEIASKLGDPVTLANQFVTEKMPEPPISSTSANTTDISAAPLYNLTTSTEPKNPPKTMKMNKVLITIGLVFADLFAVLLFILLFAWVAVLGITGIASIILSGLLLFNSDFQNLLPFIPMASAILFSLILILIAVFAAIGMFYCFLLFRQLMRAYIRWHQNTMAFATGKPVFPSLAKYPRLNPISRRRLRVVALSSLILFIVLFIAAYAVSALSAGALGFWHAWGWFQ